MDSIWILLLHLTQKFSLVTDSFKLESVKRMEFPHRTAGERLPFSLQPLLLSLFCSAHSPCTLCNFIGTLRVNALENASWAKDPLRIEEAVRPASLRPSHLDLYWSPEANISTVSFFFIPLTPANSCFLFSPSSLLKTTFKTIIGILRQDRR